MYQRFGLVLVVNHACNLRCSYCYTGEKFPRSMPRTTGEKAIDRAVASTAPGGTLELGFFGGEPLIEASLIQSFIAYAQAATKAGGLSLSITITTNGTIATPAAWAIMTDGAVDLSVSHDGLPEVHDRQSSSATGPIWRR